MVLAPPRAPITSSGGILVAAVTLGVALLWSFWDTAVNLTLVWRSSDDYSVGLLVPFASLYMIVVIVRRQGPLSCEPWLPGLLVLATGIGLNLAGTFFLYGSLENLGLVTVINGLLLTLLGRESAKRIWYPMLFLYLMVPLPGRLHQIVLLPLQTMAARMAAFLLELSGTWVERQGNILEVDGHPIGVAEACSGLRMAIAFLIVAGIIAFLARRSVWQRIVVVLSAIPVALLCNALRIVALACLSIAGYDWALDGIAHDVIGLLMMPLAIAILLVELRVMSLLENRPLELNG